MITTMRDIYPDETIYSWFARYHKISGNLSSFDTMFELINHKSRLYAFNNIYGLNNLCDALFNIFSYNPDYLIYKHTLFPLFKPFLSKEKSEKYIKEIKDNKPIKTKSIIFVSRIEKLNKFKICPVCYKEDREKYGEAYLHREHQIFGNFVCNKHKVDLISIENETNSFLDIDAIEKELNESKVYAKEKFIRLSKLLTDALNSEYLYNCTYSEIQKKYKNRLIDLGYSSREEIKKQKKLVYDFKRFYSEAFLTILKSNLDYEHNWIRNILSSKRNRLLHPLKHILFINFLFGGISEFSSYKSIEFKPFGVALWPCLNQLCPEYKNDVINECHISKPKNKHYYSGSFKCPICGFTYIRSTNKCLNDDRFRIGRVVSYGKLWDDKFKNCIHNGKHSLRELARIMLCSRSVIQTQSKRLGINVGYLSKRNYNKQIKLHDVEEKVREYKLHIIELINTEPNLTRSKVKNIFNKEYSYLYRHDRAWLEENLPKPIKIREAMSKYSKKYWTNKDDEIYKKVIEAVEKILSEMPSKRITKKYISQEIDYKGINNCNTLNKMPNTKVLLENVCESVKQFKCRK